jgi:hypothetical protein
MTPEPTRRTTPRPSTRSSGAARLRETNSAHSITQRGIECVQVAKGPVLPDRRGLMIGLALPHVVARKIGVDPAVLFTGIADRVPDSPVAQALIEFSSRRDVDLASFGWTRVETSDGPDFVPA